MKKSFKYLFALPMLALGMMACSEEGPAGEPQAPQQEIKDPVYVSFNIETPSTRSNTITDGQSNDGTLGATDAENQVGKVLIVFCDNGTNAVIDSKTITLSQPGEETLKENSKTSYTATAVYEAGGMATKFANKEVKVYIYCNPTADMTAAGARDGKITVNGANLWTDNQFVMSNVDEYKYKFPGNFKAFKSPENALNIGTVNVQRIAARFDYKAGKANNVYVLQENSSHQSEVEVKLVDMALINNSKEVYILKRTSADGKTSPVILGEETKTNYVVDTDAAWKSTYAGGAEGDHFTQLLMDNPTTWTWNNLGTNTGAYEKVRYGVENTIPADPTTTQLNGITTGVVFRGQLQAGANCPSDLKTTLDAGTDPVYVFGNVLYGTWAQVGTYAAAHPTDAVSVAYNKVNKALLVASELANAGFTGITPVENKYNVLYYYWNRHNDNGNNAVMGAMEFAVVRNNVYQLCVTNISQFGHPQVQEDPDPDPEDPKTPDEVVNKEYMTVSVNVLPWVKRVNNIEF